MAWEWKYNRNRDLTEMETPLPIEIRQTEGIETVTEKLLKRYCNSEKSVERFKNHLF